MILNKQILTELTPMHSHQCKFWQQEAWYGYLVLIAPCMTIWYSLGFAGFTPLTWPPVLDPQDGVLFGVSLYALLQIKKRLLKEASPWRQDLLHYTSAWLLGCWPLIFGALLFSLLVCYDRQEQVFGPGVMGLMTLPLFYIYLEFKSS